MSWLPRGECLALCDFETTGLYEGAEPIEVAILYLNADLRVVASVDSLIFCPFHIDRDWDALRVHRITPPMLEGAPKREQVAETIMAATARAQEVIRSKRVILCSDNAHFETSFMRKLLGDEWPFHYCTWDTSMLLEPLGIGDPRNPPHRAMADVGLLYEALLKAKAMLAALTLNTETGERK